MEMFGEGLKKIILASIGTAATTAEKSKEILDEMVKKGELTVEQGKVLNQELKHNIKKTVEDSVGEKAQSISLGKIEDMLGILTPDQLELLKEKLESMYEEKEKDESVSEETE